MNKLRTIIASPIDREDVVIEVYYEDDFLFEINTENNMIQVELYLKDNNFVVELDSFVKLLDTTLKSLIGKKENQYKIRNYNVIFNNMFVTLYTPGDYIHYLLPIHELKSILINSKDYLGNHGSGDGSLTHLIRIMSYFIFRGLII